MDGYGRFGQPPSLCAPCCWGQLCWHVRGSVTEQVAGDRAGRCAFCDAAPRAALLAFEPSALVVIARSNSAFLSELHETAMETELSMLCPSGSLAAGHPLRQSGSGARRQPHRPQLPGHVRRGQGVCTSYSACVTCVRRGDLYVCCRIWRRRGALLRRSGWPCALAATLCCQIGVVIVLDVRRRTSRKTSGSG